MHAAEPLAWQFPLPRTHTGIVLGNGVQGVMIWGVDALCLTVARAGFWDHRGGNPFTTRTTYAALRGPLQAYDAAAIAAMFAPPPAAADVPPHPQQLGGARITLACAGWRPVHATLDVTCATVTVTWADAAGAQARMQLAQAHDDEIAWARWDAALDPQVSLTPAWHWVGALLAARGVAPPDVLALAGGGAMLQTLPDDAPLALGWRRDGAQLRIATALGDDALARVDARLAGDVAALAARSAAWWQAYHASLPQLELPDTALQHAWRYGSYKLAGLTMPGGVAATLQGPWMEEYQLPPWSNDYHFNINVQMIYWPCLATGRFDHFAPLWALLRAWLPQLRANGAAFFGDPAALLMPHAVDDRCQVVGSFWTGMIDQACGAWMALLAWRYVAYTGDHAVLREIAWPLLLGTFHGYLAMLEPDGARLSLPVSVSPEYRGAAIDAWGRDASFQLAALHCLLEILPQAADALALPHDPRWAAVAAALPPYTLAGPAEAPRIGLWRGQDLDESHRHHSHLAALYPFITIDPRDPAHAPVVSASLAHWIARGAGNWSGWCVPWAAILCARCDLPDAALAWLHWWRMCFTNEGHASLHNGAIPGVTTMWGWPRAADGSLLEIMQADAAMGAVSAILELLVQERRDGVYCLPARPRDWQALRFDGIRVAGGFVIGATLAAGQLAEVRIDATRAGRLVLVPGFAGACSDGHTQFTTRHITLELAAGQAVRLRAQQDGTMTS